jgi:hypothetical protein
MDFAPESIAFREFEPLPPEQRSAEVKFASARLYIDKYAEHREVFEMLRPIAKIHGEGTKTVVRALLFYRDALAAAPKNGPRRGPLAHVLKLSQRDFRPLPPTTGRQRVRGLSVRLYVGKFREHAEAYQYLQEQDLHGDAAKTLVRALLAYRDLVLAPLSRTGHAQGTLFAAQR